MASRSECVLLIEPVGGRGVMQQGRIGDPTRLSRIRRFREGLQLRNVEVLQQAEAEHFWFVLDGPVVEEDAAEVFDVFGGFQLSQA